MTRPMDPLFDERIAEWLGGDPDTAPGEALEVVLTTFPSVAQQRVAHRVPRRLPTMSKPIRFAAAAVIGVLAIGGAVYLTRPGQPAVAGPGPTASASVSPSLAAVVAPSATPTATPSPTPKPLLWTQASLEEDWPAPVRAEPAGGSNVVPILVNEDVPGRHRDPSGDTGFDVLPLVDIREVTVPAGSGCCVVIHLVSNPPSNVDPTEQWIAYGIVLDDDRDGVPDWRFGIDNMPRNEELRSHRAWRTDLHTGRTETVLSYHIGILLAGYWPDGGSRDRSATFVFGGDVTGDGPEGKDLDVPFYVWASVIQDGRVVASDYAPDAGWLDIGSSPEMSHPPGAPTPEP